MRVSRKKFVKKLMSYGVSRNRANETADLTAASNRSYREVLAMWQKYIIKKILEYMYDAHVVMHTNAFTPVMDIRPQVPACGVRDAPLTASALVTAADRKEG